MTEQETLSLIEKINDYWMKTEPEKKNQSWESACYFLGSLSAWNKIRREEWLESAVSWAEYHGYMPFGTPEYAKDVLLEHFSEKGDLGWTYEHVSDYRHIHADHILCTRIYLFLLMQVPSLRESVNLDGLKATFDFMARDPHDDYWWWIDAIHMGLATFHKAADYWNEPAYAEKGHLLYLTARKKCYSEKEGLWYRDWRFIPKNGDEDVFWSRGNGWVYAGLAHALSTVAKDSRYYAEYKADFLKLTERILDCLCKDGFWHSDLKRPDRYDTPETSGTLMFLFGLLRGISLGILQGGQYEPIAERILKAVVQEAISDEGRILYVQGVADRPGPVERGNTRAYAVGYMLLVLCEWLDIQNADDTSEENRCFRI